MHHSMVFINFICFFSFFKSHHQTTSARLSPSLACLHTFLNHTKFLIGIFFARSKLISCPCFVLCFCVPVHLEGSKRISLNSSIGQKNTSMNTSFTKLGSTPSTIEYRKLFSKATKAIVWGMQTRAVQSMLDFDFICRREEPSVVAMVRLI